MREYKKLAAVLSTAAFMTLGAAFSSMASSGWVQNDGFWQYYDKDGSYASGCWRKSKDVWYYLDEEGNMAADTLIEATDGYYAVDANGAMIKNTWKELTDENNESHWYYFQASGKAKEDGFLTVGKDRYHFTDSKMEEGWLKVEEDTYLLNKNHDGTFGSVVKGWAYVDDFDEEDDVMAEEEGWYYFDSNGKLFKNAEKKINGQYYVFNEAGLMLDNWVKFNKTDSDVNPDESEDPDSIYKFYMTAEGQRSDKWVYIGDMEEDEGRETEEGWYYFKNGVPYSSNYKTTAIADGYGVAKVNGKVYCFDKIGKMVTGKVDSDNETYFYFDDDNGAMKYGKVKITNSEDLDDGTYYFSDKGNVGEKGESYTGVYKGYLYNNGILIEAEEGMTYEKVTVDGKDYMVNESGKVTTSGIVKDDNNQKWQITKGANGDYIITNVQ